MIHPPLWTVEAMAAAMGCARTSSLPDSVCGISIDSRTIAPGEAFFAIKGESRDGHDFVPAAIKAGAALAVVEDRQRSRFGEEIANSEGKRQFEYAVKVLGAYRLEAWLKLDGEWRPWLFANPIYLK